MSHEVQDAGEAGEPLRHALPIVFVGGMLGTALRIAITEALPHGAFAWGVLLANLTGAFLLGLLYERLQEHRLRRGDRWALWGPGFLGAFTTFSALQFEAVDAIRAGDTWHGVLYLVATIGLGVPLAAIGRRVGRGGR
ncbi:MAG: fluoride efflux transporter FluC [Gaiellales bacterium]